MNKNYSKVEILQLIHEKKISAKEGLSLLKSMDLEEEITLYKPERIEIERRESTSFKGKKILLFAQDTEIRNKLAEKLEIGISDIVMIRFGGDIGGQDENVINMYTIEELEYINILKELISRNFTPDEIIHYWSNPEYDENPGNINEQISKSFYSVFYIAQACLKLKVKKKLNFRCFYAYVNGKNPIYESMDSIAKTLHSENCNWESSNIRVEFQTGNISADKISGIIAKEIVSDMQFDELLYKNDKVYTKQYTKVETHELNTLSRMYSHGVYLITGGTGGLGSKLAFHLAKKYNANLVLTGRKDKDKKIDELLYRLKNIGAEAVYINCNLNKIDDVKALKEFIFEKYGNINGVFHCAGILRDALIINKEYKDIESVFGPKIYGSINLHKIIMPDVQDFFVFFSGLASVIGNAGQIDYSYANAFMENYTNYLNMEDKEKKYLSIAWPFWKDGGMKIDANNLEHLYEMYGLIPLETDEGMEILEAIVNSSICNVAVAKVRAKKENLFNRTKSYIDLNDSTIQSREKISKSIEKYLREVIGEEIKLEPGKLLLSEPWEAYGINSVSIVKITNQMEKKFGILSKTLFFEYQTLGELINYFIENYPEVVERKLSYDTLVNIPNKKEVGEITPIKEEVTEESYNSEEACKDIAIIGISGRYPMANNLDQYWDNLKKGKDCISEIPKERWDLNDFYGEVKGEKGKSYSKWGGFIDSYDKFDPLFFGITPKDAEMMEPQERLFLEEAWHSMEDAGYTIEKLRKYEVGVYAGVMYGQYQIFGAEETIKGNPMALSSSYSAIANRVSYLLDLKGPSIAVDTMCSSSLTTLHLACESIKSGECQMAFAGGVNLSIHPAKYLYLCASNFASSDGRCRSFGSDGDGYVPSEGVGVVLVKELSQAEKDGDHIYAVIKGSAINHGGRANGFTVPNPNSQAALIKKTLLKARINPKEISYVEAHGTGTSLGDPIEITGLSKAYSQYTSDKQYCPIGSVKANIGHAESAAGIAGLTKVILQMKYKKLVPSIHSEIINKNIDFGNSPFYVQKELEDWNSPIVYVDGKKKECKRIAAVSAFGAGGSNAHIILEEYIGKNYSESKGHMNNNIIILSARNKQQLHTYIKSFLVFLENIEDMNFIPIDEFAYTLQTGREAKEFKIGFTARSMQEVYDVLEDVYENLETSKVVLRSWDILDNDVKDDYMKDLKAWINGEHVDWDILYGNVHPRLMSLPTYPFEEKRYWYDSYQKNNQSSNAEKVKRNINTMQNTHEDVVFTEDEDEDIEFEGREVTLQIIDDSIALIIMHDEMNKNMFSEKLVKGLKAKFIQIRKMPNIKVLIITGYDNIFSMGGTQEQLLEIANHERSFTDVPFLYRGLLEFPIPVIAAIQGHASGGGLLFGLYADIVYMAEDSIYSAVFTKYGFTPGMGATYILKEKFGVNLSTEMMLTAKSYTGKELREKGAGIMVANSKKVLEETIKIARLIADKPLTTLRILKSELSARILSALPNYIERESIMHEETFGKPEVKERINKYFLNARSFSKKSVESDSTATDWPRDQDINSLLELLERGEITPEEAANVDVFTQEV